MAYCATKQAAVAKVNADTLPATLQARSEQPGAEGWRLLCAGANPVSARYQGGHTVGAECELIRRHISIAGPIEQQKR